MNSRTPMQTLFRDAFLAVSAHGANKPIAEISAYVELLIDAPDGVIFVSLAPNAGEYEWRLLLLTKGVAVHGTFGTTDEGAGRFFVELRVEPLKSVTSFRFGSYSSAVREASGHVSSLDPQIIVKFANWDSLSIGGKNGFGWGFPEGTEDVASARDALIRRLLKAYLSET